MLRWEVLFVSEEAKQNSPNTYFEEDTTFRNDIWHNFYQKNKWQTK